MATDLEMKADPILTLADSSEGGLNLFRSFLQAYEQPAPGLAEREALRLTPYFNAMSSHLGSALTNGIQVRKDYFQQAPEDLLVSRFEDRFKHASSKTEPVQPLTKTEAETLASPSVLNDLFIRATARRNNVILSAVNIVPDSFLDGPLSEQALKDTTGFNVLNNHNGRPIRFGFIQVFDKTSSGKGSVSLPVLSLDTDMMTLLEKTGAQEILKPLHALYTAGNHDMLHHFSSEVINEGIARKDETPLMGFFGRVNDSNMEKWSIHNFTGNDHDATGYESWLVSVHSRISRQLEQSAILHSHLKEYFDGLDTLRDTLLDGANDESTLHHAHTVIDYFSTVAITGLMRLVPMTDLLMQYALDRAESADPVPALLMNDDAFSAFRAVNTGLHATAIKNYEEAGHQLSRDFSYRSHKQMQAIKIIPTIAFLHAPLPSHKLTADELGQISLQPLDPNSSLDMEQNLWNRQTSRADQVAIEMLYALSGDLGDKNDPVEHKAVKNFALPDFTFGDSEDDFANISNVLCQTGEPVSSSMTSNEPGIKKFKDPSPG